MVNLHLCPCPAPLERKGTLARCNSVLANVVTGRCRTAKKCKALRHARRSQRPLISSLELRQPRGHLCTAARCRLHGAQLLVSLQAAKPQQHSNGHSRHSHARRCCIGCSMWYVQSKRTHPARVPGTVVQANRLRQHGPRSVQFKTEEFLCQE